MTIRTVKKYPVRTGSGQTRREQLRLGSAHFTIKHGHRETVTVQLNGNALRKLGHVHSVQVEIGVADHDGLGHTATSSRQVTLELP